MFLFSWEVGSQVAKERVVADGLIHDLSHVTS